jgi:1-acyl-sn-glycerol-3-phosphate acyltransferase
VLGILGWRFDGSIPNLGRAVVIVAPHTSNWDFVVGVAAMFAIGIRVVFLGKHTLFRLPLGPIMRWLGGVPVDRRVTAGLVESAVAAFGERDEMILALAPEGTRRPVERWRTGFYFVAHGAHVPIVPIALDYEQRTIAIGGPVIASGDLECDLAVLRRFFSGRIGRRQAHERRDG